MDDIITGISGLLRLSWNFLMHTFIPGTDIAFGVLFVGLCMVSLGFKFLSLVVGHSIGDVSTLSSDFRVASKDYGRIKERISSSRRNDTV